MKTSFKQYKPSLLMALLIFLVFTSIILLASIGAPSLAVRIFLLLLILPYSIILIILLDTGIGMVKCVKENKLISTGKKSFACISKISIRSQSASNIKRKRNIYRAKTNYIVKLEFKNENRETAYYTPARFLNAKQIEYLKLLKQIPVFVDNKRCTFAIDFDALDLDNEINKLKNNVDEFADYSLKTGKDKDIEFEDYNIMKPSNAKIFASYCFIFIIMTASLVFTLIMLSKLRVPKIVTITFIAFSLISLLFIVLYSIKYFKSIVPKNSTKTFAETFTIHKTQLSSSARNYIYLCKYTFVDESGNRKTKSEYVDIVNYPRLTNIEKLPILVYKSRAAIDYDALPLI